MDTPVGHGCIGIKNALHNKWVGADLFGSPYCNPDRAGSWEKWYGWKDHEDWPVAVVVEEVLTP